MRAERFGQAGLVLLALGLVLLGLVTVGGPAKGRTEAQDRTRLSDLQTLATYVDCVAETQGKRLPETLDRVEACQDPIRLADPFTGEGYRYERVSATAYRVCARFADLAGLSAVQPVPDVDRVSGCMLHPYRP